MDSEDFPHFTTIWMLHSVQTQNLLRNRPDRFYTTRYKGLLTNRQLSHLMVWWGIEIHIFEG